MTDVSHRIDGTDGGSAEGNHAGEEQTIQGGISACSIHGAAGALKNEKTRYGAGRGQHGEEW